MIGSDHGQLADLADAQEENGFLDVVDRIGQAVIDRIDQVQQAGGQAGVAADDFGDLRGVSLVGAEKFLQGAFNAAQGRQAGGAIQPGLNLLVFQTGGRRSSGGLTIKSSHPYRTNPPKFSANISPPPAGGFPAKILFCRAIRIQPSGPRHRGCPPQGCGRNSMPLISALCTFSVKVICTFPSVTSTGTLST